MQCSSLWLLLSLSLLPLVVIRLVTHVICFQAYLIPQGSCGLRRRSYQGKRKKERERGNQRISFLLLCCFSPVRYKTLVLSLFSRQGWLERATALKSLCFVCCSKITGLQVLFSLSLSLSSLTPLIFVHYTVYITSASGGWQPERERSNTAVAMHWDWDCSQEEGNVNRVSR